MHRYKTFFACGSSAPVRVEPEGGTADWLVGTVAMTNVQGHRLPPPQKLWPIRVFFRASCSWQSEGLFGRSFSVALPIQELRGLLCLGSFSVVQSIRHIEGLPWLGSYSVDRCISHLKEHPGWVPTPQFGAITCLMGQPLCHSAAGAGVWGERGYGDGPTRYTGLHSIALFAWLPGFPPQAFPTTISSLTSPRYISLRSTAALT